MRTLPGLSWPQVIAGVLLALAAHVVLGLIGAALGLSARPTDSGALAVLAGFWGLLTPFVATVLGAWLACRLAGVEEVRATNLHGVMVWCIGIIAGALFLTGTTATGAMSASTAASGNAGFLSRATGATRPMAEAPQGAAADRAAATGAKIAGGAAMAGLAGLLGAFAGAAIARSRRKGRGIGWRIALQRTAHPGARGRDGGRMGERRPEYPDRTYPASEEERAREVERAEGPGAPPADYHH